MNRQLDKKGQRAKQFAESVLIIGPIAATWGFGMVISWSVLFLWPQMPPGRATEYTVMIWALIGPIATLICFLLILVLFKAMLWAVSETAPQRPRHENGRFAPATNGKKREYLMVREVNEGKSQ